MSSTIPKTQSAAVVTTLGEALVIRHDYPVTQPAELKPGECLVKLDYSGVCHSDLHIRNGDWSLKASIPVVGGHEGVGHVVAIGEHTTSNAVKMGDRVGVKWIAKVCTQCEMCRKGFQSCCLSNFAQRGPFSGFTNHGTFQQYIVSFVDYVTPIPVGVESAAAAPILCAGLTVYKALKSSNTIAGNWVAISGAGGGLGHLAVQYAVAMGLRVLAIDTGSAKKDLVLKLGAEKWIDFRESKNVIADVLAETGGLGPHAAIITAGQSEPFNQAPMYLRPAGTMVMVGAPGNAFFHVPIEIILGKALRIVGSAIGDSQDAIEAFDFVARGKVHCHFKVVTLDDVNQVLDDLNEGTVPGRVVLKL